MTTENVGNDLPDSVTVTPTRNPKHKGIRLTGYEDRTTCRTGESRVVPRAEFMKKVQVPA